MADKTYTEQGKQLASDGAAYVQEKASAVSHCNNYFFLVDVLRLSRSHIRRRQDKAHWGFACSIHRSQTQ
jgi:hypothetical protein